MAFNLRRTLFGNPIATEAAEHERLTKVRALAVFSSDALSSVAYATEEILLVLVTVGTAVFSLSIPVAVTICALLAVVTISYRQTINAYPSGGGAFVVALDNMGEWWGLVAAASLLIDYVLTVAVSVSAGIRAVTSAFPEFLPYTVLLCVVSIVLVMWLNLRGIRESAGIFAVPTYVFILLTVLLVVVGVFGMATGNLSTLPDIKAAHDAAVVGAQNVGLLLLLRAFSAGCTAMTGVEAVSNGVPAFRDPAPRNASVTLMVMSGALAFMFIGVTVLGYYLDAVPRDEESVISQVARTVFGHGWLYYGFQAATALILMLAANTSFAGFPMLASVLAKADYLPRQLANLGDRLAFTNGIVALAGLAIVLVIAFNGSTDALVPLYAVGVFTGFSLSQAGMVMRWARLQTPGWEMKATINGIGCVCTTIALAVIVETKFAEGAWIIIMLIPVVLYFFKKVKHHYGKVTRELSPRLGGIGLFMRTLSAYEPKVVVPISKLHRGTLAALNHARSLSSDVTAVVVDLEPAATAELKLAWTALRFPEPLVVLHSSYRSIVAPLMDYLDEVDAREPERGPAVVVLPLFVPRKWWHHLLHNQTALMLKAALLYRRGPENADARIIVDVPYHLKT